MLDITFKSTAVRQTGVDRGEVICELTIHGVTEPVSLDVALQFEGDHPLGPFIKAYAGAPYVSFSGRTEILRSEFGVGEFAPRTSDRVEIVIETEMRQQNQQLGAHVLDDWAEILLRIRNWAQAGAEPNV